MLDEIDVDRGTEECAGTDGGKSEQNHWALSNVRVERCEQGSEATLASVRFRTRG